MNLMDILIIDEGKFDNEIYYRIRFDKEKLKIIKDAISNNKNFSQLYYNEHLDLLLNFNNDEIRNLKFCKQKIHEQDIVLNLDYEDDYIICASKPISCCMNLIITKLNSFEEIKNFSLDNFKPLIKDVVNQTITPNDDILIIDGTTVFLVDNWYFDDKRRRFYFISENYSTTYYDKEKLPILKLTLEQATIHRLKNS